ncbi:UbiH/UbiF family hydroxylase [Azospira restricta]|uniref:UbiH/UbiF family hydroxylase n=1 Tax=Azospira restricta TaxID=404405 RepID=A0A974Y3L3_9RHOO|nr:UbiH/UbiF family hydroxylase [Azospira restricta]QRJ63963.1 UbiH/UbiF family hydroxylase [Azospira restricta]
MHFDLIIVGGGLAGLSLACALRDTSLRIALLEQRPPRRPEGWDARVYAISPANRSFLDGIGVWKHLDATRIASISAMQVYGDAGARLDFSAYETGVGELGFILESSLMACELWENVKRQGNVTLFCPGSPQRVEMREDAALLGLADGRTLSARLLVAADGRDSWLRRACGLDAFDTHYNEQGVVANFACERPHRGIAYQWFRDDGVLAYLPLPEKRISIVWSAPDELADELVALPPDELCTRVAAAGGHALGALSPLTPAVAFPLRLMHVPQVVAPRLALVGDAAHGIHPLSGHGINLGYQDARALAETLAACQPWHDIGSLRVLERYQRARKEEVLLLQTGTDALRRLFKAELPGLKPLRNLGMNLTNALPLLKNMLARYALGGF